MYTKWTQHLSTDEEKIEFEKDILRAKPVLNFIRETILTQMWNSVEDEELSVKAYDKPNWEFRRANTDGYKRCLRDLNKLLNLDQQETNRDRQSIRGTDGASANN